MQLRLWEDSRFSREGPEPPSPHHCLLDQPCDPELPWPAVPSLAQIVQSALFFFSTFKNNLSDYKI